LALILLGFLIRTPVVEAALGLADAFLDLPRAPDPVCKIVGGIRPANSKK